MRQTFAVQQNRLAVAGVLALALSGLLALQRTSASTSQTVVAVGGDWAGQCSNVVTWTGITAIAAGDAHSVGLKSDGSVVAVGWNDSHQTEVSGWTGVTAIAAGYQHTVGLKGDGTVVAVGLNDNGQCDLSGWSGITAVAAGFGHTVGLKADGTVVAAGDNTHHECDVSGWTGITAIAAGWGHTLGVKDDGTVVATGLNDSGQCNVSSWSGIKAVGGGWLHSAGLKSDGTVVAVGTNDVGQCNVSGWSGIAAISTGCGHTVGLKNDGTVVATGWNENGQCNVAGMAGIAAIAAGKYHTVGLAVDPCVVINTNDSGPGSLRSAITYANANPGTTIRFSIPGPTTIRPASALPTLTANGTVIDGTTQPGYAGTPVIEVSGANAGAGVSGFQIAAANCVLKGLVANRFAVSGVRIGGASASGNLVQGCFIGTNATGGIAAPNGEDGVAILNGASNNAVGGTAVGMGNVLSGNAREGVAIWDAATSGNTVQGNKIGTNPTGDSAVPNQNLGVAIWWGAHDNTIGGTAPNAGNVISGNRNGGIYFAGASSTGNRVQGNRVGTNATGTAAVANGSVGIQLDGAVNATIGGTTAGARNLISGNNGQGIALSSAASSNVIQGNFIGTNGDGTAAIPNATHGVSAWGGAQSNTVGGTAAGAGNLVSGNAGIGIFFIDNCSGNTLQGNQVGTNAAGAAAIPNGWNGVEISGSPNNTIGGVASGAGNVISGNSASGISIIGGANGTRVQGNLIGTTKDGMAALGNAHTGIGLWDGPTDCVIGGTAAGAGNVVCASGHTGITLNGAHTLRTVVQGNLVGTNKAGSAAIGNSPQGITVESGASNNTIGGTAAGAGNIVSGSSYSGILLTGSGTSANVIQGNLIGTNKGGTAAFGNAYYGVEISDGAKNNAIGDGATGARNIISGNGRSGVYLHDTGTDGNTIQGNYIGTDKNGTSAVGNAEAAVLLAGGAKGNLIGGAGAGQGNLLSGNGHEGVAIWNAGTENNRVQGNLIGTDATGAVALGNRFQGILVGDGAKAVVGGTGSGEGNHIAFNSEAGIWVLDTSVGCVLRGNLVHSNGKVGIDLAGGTETLAGVTANDAGDADTGSNNLQNYPVLTGQTVTAGVTTLRGTLNSTANATFALDFFANTAADPSGYGEGESYLGSTSVTTNGSGNVTFTFGAGSGLGGKAFTATATNTATGDTSEFSQAFVDTTPTLAAQSGRTSAEGDIVDAQLAGAADADGDALTWSATGLPAGLSISAAGRVTGTVAYTASAGSPYTVTVTVTDGTPGGTGGDSASRTFAWTVTNSDATPTLAEIANQSSAEGDAINLAVLGADADGDTLAYGATGLPPGLQINGATGAITGTLPNLASSGSPYSVTVTVTDNTPGGIGGDSASRTFSWTVINVDAPPSLAAQPDRENF